LSILRGLVLVDILISIVYSHRSGPCWHMNQSCLFSQVWSLLAYESVLSILTGLVLVDMSYMLSLVISCRWVYK